MSQGKDYGQDTYMKEMIDIRDGLSLTRERNLAKRLAKEAEESGKNVIIEMELR